MLRSLRPCCDLFSPSHITVSGLAVRLSSSFSTHESIPSGPIDLCSSYVHFVQIVRTVCFSIPNFDPALPHTGFMHVGLLKVCLPSKDQGKERIEDLVLYLSCVMKFPFSTRLIHSLIFPLLLIYLMPFRSLAVFKFSWVFASLTLSLHIWTMS